MKVNFYSVFFRIKIYLLHVLVVSNEKRALAHLFNITS